MLAKARVENHFARDEKPFCWAGGGVEKQGLNVRTKVGPIPAWTSPVSKIGNAFSQFGVKQWGHPEGISPNLAVDSVCGLPATLFH